jgi:hypothetical protein
MVVATTTYPRLLAIHLEPMGLTRLTGGLIHGSLSAPASRSTTKRSGQPSEGGSSTGAPDRTEESQIWPTSGGGGRSLEASAQTDERVRRDAASVPESTGGSGPIRSRGACGGRRTEWRRGPPTAARGEFSPPSPSLRRVQFVPALRSGGGEAGGVVGRGSAAALGLGLRPCRSDASGLNET